MTLNSVLRTSLTREAVPAVTWSPGGRNPRGGRCCGHSGDWNAGPSCLLCGSRVDTDATWKGQWGWGWLQVHLRAISVSRPSAGAPPGSCLGHSALQWQAREVRVSWVLEPGA